MQKLPLHLSYAYKTQLNNWTLHEASFHMCTDHFPDKNIHQTTLEMRTAILKSWWRKSCAHTMFGTCANMLTKIRAIMQHFQFQEKTCVKNSIRILHYSYNNFEWLFISLLLHNMLDGLTSALTSLSKRQEERWSLRASPVYGLFCTSPLDWNPQHGIRRCEKWRKGPWNSV